MSRPEFVRCRTCVFWKDCSRAETEAGFIGADDVSSCHVNPVAVPKSGDDFCGRYRMTWPGVRVPAKRACELCGAEEMATLVPSCECRKEPAPEITPEAVQIAFIADRLGKPVEEVREMTWEQAFDALRAKNAEEPR